MSPIFIGGCPRSGTTMLASMLGCASDTIVTPESHFKEQLLNNNNKNTCSEDKNDWELHANFRVWLQDEEFRKNWKHFSNKNRYFSPSPTIAFPGIYFGFIIT